MNKKAHYLLPLLLFTLAIYFLAFYLTFSLSRSVDYTPFYISSKLLILGKNPYSVTSKIPANLNPPFFVFLFYPLGLMSYFSSIISCSLLYFILGLIAVRYAFFYAFSEEFRQQYQLILYLIYLNLFAVFMDTSIVQLGSVLFFFTMVGYHFYLQEKDYLAGILWGLIIAIKFFPALLFFYVLKQGRYRVFLIMLATVLLACLLPLLIYGPTIYRHYFTMMAKVYWYGDNWNGSLLGYLFRLKGNLNKVSWLGIQAIYLGLFVIVLGIYLKTMGSKEIGEKTKQVNHQPFCLTLAVMMLLSPFGWVYYYTLLLFPLLLTGVAAFQEKSKTQLYLVCWVICFCLLNFPEIYATSHIMTTLMERVGVYSFYFYGLVLLVGLLITRQQLPGNRALNLREINEDEFKHGVVLVLVLSLIFGIITPLHAVLLRVSTGGSGNYTVQDLDQLIYGK